MGFSCSVCRGAEEDAEAGVEAPTDELVGEEEAPPAETEWEREGERERCMHSVMNTLKFLHVCLHPLTSGGLNQ